MLTMTFEQRPVGHVSSCRRVVVSTSPREGDRKDLKDCTLSDLSTLFHRDLRVLQQELVIRTASSSVRQTSLSTAIRLHESFAAVAQRFSSYHTTMRPHARAGYRTRYCTYKSSRCLARIAPLSQRLVAYHMRGLSNEPLIIQRMSIYYCKRVRRQCP